MAGIAALGAAVGGLTKGYMEGEKHRSEMEDAEARRGLVKLQMEKTDLDLKAARKKQAGQDELEAIVNEYMPKIEGAATAAPAAATAEAAPATGAEAAPAAPRMGLAGPASSATAAPATPAAPAEGQKSPWELRQEMYTRLNLAALKQADSPEAIQKAMAGSLTMMKAFRDARADETISAMRNFMATGDQTSSEAMLRQAGVPMIPGAKFEMAKTPVYPGSKIEMDDVVLRAPDGRTVSMNQIMASRMDPKDYFASQTRVAELQQQAAYQNGVLEIQRQTAETQATNARAHLAQVAAQTQLMKRQADLADQKFNFDAVQAMNNRASEEAMRLLGVPKDLTAKERIEVGDEAAAAYDAKRQGMLNRFSTVMANYGLNNRRANDGKELVPVSIVDKATSLAKTKPDDVKTDDGLNYYVKIGDRQIFVLPPAQKQTPPAAGAPGAPAPAAPAPAAAARPGLQSPSIVDVETREIELGRRTGYSAQAQAEIARLEQARSQANQQALTAEQQRQIAASRGIAAQYR